MVSEIHKNKDNKEIINSESLLQKILGNSFSFREFI